MESVMPKVSVVVPIYNVERYLRQCLDSVIGQTLNELQIVLVDDGSTDGCPGIVDEYAARDARIVAIHQPNRGSGAARNTGIRAATGAYIGFVDSDDWVEPDMFQSLYDAAVQHGTDMTGCLYYHYDSQAKDPAERDQLRDWAGNSAGRIFKVEDFSQVIIGYHWRYLYRSELVRQVPFVEGEGTGHEDVPFSVECSIKAQSILTIPRGLYHYRNEGRGQKNSASQFNRGLLKIINCQAEVKEILQRYNKYDIWKEEYYHFACRLSLNFYKKINYKYKKEFFYRFREFMTPLADDVSFQGKYFSIEEKRFLRRLLRGQYYLSWFCSFKDVRKFIFSLNFGRSGCIFQLLGLQISSGKYVSQPALLAYRIDR
jgi:glycosyltransferase involved in cell wall biosynthesis